MRNNRAVKAVYAALFTALIFVGTQFIRVPLPFGYFNMGDCIILLSVMIIGCPYAIISAAMGAALADVLSGYIIYAPATLIIKSLMVIAMAASLKLWEKRFKKHQGVVNGACAALAELIMVSGYFVYDTIIYGFSGAIVSLPGNVIQGVSAAAAYVVIAGVLRHGGFLKRVRL